MEQKRLISVIIPIYNAETFVRRAVESVLVQLNGQVELILVDDGSTDGSGSICDEYSNSRPDVQTVHKVNGGLSSARNAGMAVATGEYIVFLDADDYLAPNTCEELTKVIHAHRPDFIDFGWNYVNVEGELVPNLNKVPKNRILGKDFIRDKVLPPLLHLHGDADEYFIYEFACMKAFARRIIEENKVYFDEGRRIWEDRPFVCHYLKYCSTYYSMDQCLYYYVYVEGSLSQRYHLDFLRVMLVTFQHYVRVYGEEFDFDTPYINNYWCCAIENMILRSLEQKQNQEAIRENILKTLGNEQVIHWYGNRQPKDGFEEQVAQLVTSGKPEDALAAYQKKSGQLQRKKAWLHLKNRIKSILRRLLGR